MGGEIEAGLSGIVNDLQLDRERTEELEERLVPTF
jgi:hypothetical protein